MSSDKRKRVHNNDDVVDLDEVNPAIPSSSKRLKQASETTLLDLSDDVLLIIFTHLSTPDLFALTQTCSRLSRVASDQTLWKKVETSPKPLSIAEFRKILPFLSEKTVHISIGGFLNHRNKMHNESVSPSILEVISGRCPKLETFELRHCFVDASKIKISLFPKSVRHLGLVDCEVINVPTKESYFFNIHTLLPHLESLDLSNNPWLQNHSIQALCKCENLLKISFRGCLRMGECFVYTALATRFGFRKVTSMDLRDTSVGDSEVPCFGRLPEIRKLLLGHTSDTEFVPPPDSEGQGVITDRGVLSMCPIRGDPHVSKLQHLSLTNTMVTEKSVEKLLKGLPLVSLDITGSNVAADGIEPLLGLRPSCKVTYNRSDR